MVEATLTTLEAATVLGVSQERVRQLIKAGRLPSRQYGRDHLIKESDLALVANRKNGRPSKKAQTVDSPAIEASPAEPKKAARKQGSDQ